MASTLEGLTYADLERTLVPLGFQIQDHDDRRVFKHPSEALLIYPIVPLDSNVRGYHYLMAKMAVDGFGIMDAGKFDLLLLRVTHTKSLAATPS